MISATFGTRLRASGSPPQAFSRLDSSAFLRMRSSTVRGQFPAVFNNPNGKIFTLQDAILIATHRKTEWHLTPTKQSTGLLTNRKKNGSSEEKAKVVSARPWEAKAAAILAAVVSGAEPSLPVFAFFARPWRAKVLFGRPWWANALYPYQSRSSLATSSSPRPACVDFRRTHRLICTAATPLP